MAGRPAIPLIKNHIFIHVQAAPAAAAAAADDDHHFYMQQILSLFGKQNCKIFPIIPEGDFTNIFIVLRVLFCAFLSFLFKRNSFLKILKQIEF